MRTQWWIAAGAAALFAGIVTTALLPAEAEAAARKGRLVGATYNNGVWFRVSGENLGRATWTRRATTGRDGLVATEAGTAAVGRRTYTYSARIYWSPRTRTGRPTSSGTVTVSGGLLSPRSQSVRF